MDIIDFHTHFFPDALASRAVKALLPVTPLERSFTDGSQRGLIESMDSAGITRSVVLPVATKQSQVKIINEHYQNLSSDRIISMGALFPPAQQYQSDLNDLVKAGARGVKTHPVHQDFFAADPVYFPLYERLQAENLIAVFHAGCAPGPFPTDRCPPSALRIIHDTFPRLVIVATHMGGLYNWPDVEKSLVGCDNVYFDTSAVSQELSPTEVVSLIRSHGPQKIFFGTDSPWFDQKKEVEWIDTLELSVEEKEMVLGGNAARVLFGAANQQVPDDSRY